MKKVYPIILTLGEKYVLVYIPDFNINTQGVDFAEAIEMARDAIGIMGIDMEDDGEELPEPTPIGEVRAEADAIVSLVDVDFLDYRRKNDMRSVKKNCTLPSWLCYRAEKEHINFSQILQAGLMKELNIT